jgi:glycosyltransferase involved in cell wall biosynthesis
MSGSGAELHLVVPVYNEAENFPRFYESVRAHIRTPNDITVVYDREDDTTVPIVRELGRNDPGLILLRNPSPGVLGALRTGLAAAPGGAIVVSMADGSDDHRCVDRMYAMYLEGYDLVSASRYMPGGEQRGGPMLKGLLSRGAGWSLHRFAGLPTCDPTNNFKLYRKTFLEGVTIESEGGFEIALELTVKAHLAGLRIGEVPSVWTDRLAGRSNFKLLRWLPRYLRWYRLAFRGAPGRRE